MLPLIAAAIGVGRAGVGMIQANQQKQRARGVIGRAYARGRERLDLQQGDVRQSTGEGLIARGLAGGGLHVGGPVGPGDLPGMSGAHDLGGQLTADLAREQTLEQNSLRDQRDEAYGDIKSDYHGALISNAMNGIEAGINAYTGGQALSAGSSGGGSSSTPPIRAHISGGASDFDAAPRARSGWGGIDPVDPLGRGAWAQGTTAGSVSDPSLYRGGLG